MGKPNARGLIAFEAGRPHLSTFVQIPDANVVEILSRTALDSVILDCQHGMFSAATISDSIASAAHGGKGALIRIPVGDYAFGSRALDLGAAGIVCPMVESAAEARALVNHVKYPPVGSRSWGPRRALPLSGLTPPEYLQQANTLTHAFAMIETARALEKLDEILSVPGIDGAFVGPTDFCVSLTNGEAVNVTAEVVIEAVEAVAAACRRHGKHAAIFALDSGQAVGHVGRGYNVIALAQDAMFMAQAADGSCADVRNGLATKSAA